MVDLTGGTVHAHLGNVVVGQKDNLPGGQQGSLFIGNDATNTIVAQAVLIGGTSATGRIDYAGGDFSANTIGKGDGTAIFNWTGGALHVSTFGTQARPLDLNNTSAGVLAPGVGAPVGTTQVFGNYQQGAGAALQIDLAGVLPGEFDRLSASGSVKLGGALEVRAVGNFIPLPGTIYDIIAGASLTGIFGSVINGTPYSVTFTPIYNPTPGHVGLSVGALAGDANLDGKVTGADYTIWAANFNKNGDWLAGDFNGDGKVTGADYTIWAANFGSAAAALPNIAPIPEPSTAVLLAIAVATAPLVIRRQPQARPRTTYGSRTPCTLNG